MSTSFEKKSNQQRLLAFAGVAIVLLLITVAALLYNKYGQEKELETKQIEIEQVEEVKAELQEEYDNAIAELDEALAENTGLGDVIQKQKTDLEKQKSKISSILRSSKSSKSELKKARGEIKNLIRNQSEFLARIDQLEKEKVVLTESNIRLSEEKQNLQTEIVREKENTQALSNEKAQLESEKTNLEQQKDVLSKKVDVASAVKVAKLSGTGFKIRKSGKRVKKRYAKNIDVINLCFTTLENDVVAPGMEAFYIRMISPLGETLYIEELGSGVTVHSKTNEQMRYTKKAEVEYGNDATQACIEWQPGQAFVKGIYDVEIYNKGYLAGKGTYTMK